MNAKEEMEEIRKADKQKGTPTPPTFLYTLLPDNGLEKRPRREGKKIGKA
jgi:hypothetical protein